MHQPARLENDEWIAKSSKPYIITITKEILNVNFKKMYPANLKVKITGDFGLTTWKLNQIII